MSKAKKMLVPAGSLKPGQRFAKKGGEVSFTVIKRRGLGYLTGEGGNKFVPKQNLVYAVDERGSTSTRKVDQDVHPLDSQGNAHTTIVDAQVRLEQAQGEFVEAETAMEAARDDLAFILGWHLQMNPDKLAGLHGGHDCVDSPTGCCIYNVDDPEWCIICGDPREQK
jgi:hypothetical protein